MNVDLKSHYFMQSQFKASSNSLSKNVVAGFDQKKSQFNLEGDGKNLLKMDQKEKKEKKEQDPYQEKNKKSNEDEQKPKTIKKLMNII